MMSTMNKAIILLFTLVYFTPVMAETDSKISTLQGNELKSYITNYALNHMQHQDDETIEVNIMQIDQNITLPQCSEPVDIEMSNQSLPEQSTAVTLSCKAQPQWNVYVPINVKILTNVLIANRFIRSGEMISDEDISYAKQDKNRLSDGFFKDNQALIGLAARHSIYAGSVFSKTNTMSVPVIKKNQTISLAIRTGSVEIQMLGIAKSDGYLNEPIKVLNPSSKKIIDAIVKSNDKAEINY